MIDEENTSAPNILIVDDMPANLKLLSALLKDEGYKVRPVLNGKQALQAASKEKPDLILLDIMMPEISGYELCRMLKGNPELMHIPVIFISALNEPNDIVKAFDNGGVDYITKPFKAEEVKARVTTHLKIEQQRHELHQLNITKDKFFSILAHDLRNPFSVLIGISDILMKDFDSMDRDLFRELIVMQNNTTKQTFALLQNLLEWSRINRNSIQFAPYNTNLLDVIDENIDMLRPFFESKKIQISRDISCDIWISADINMLNAIFRNLLVNAIKFTYEDGAIKVSAIENDSVVEVSVSDNGVGIFPADLPRLFNIEGHTTEGTAHETGSGLGLVLCKEFVEKHGGQISVESEPGKGSTFRFTIPLIKE